MKNFPKRPRIDRNSPYYRVCKECHHEFIAKHRSQIYCDEKCADGFHNKQKKSIAKAYEYLSKNATLSNTKNRKRKIWICNNINILDLLTINDIDGSSYSIEEIIKAGINLEFVDRRIMADENKGICIDVMGKYALIHEFNNVIRIFHTL